MEDKKMRLPQEASGGSHNALGDWGGEG